MSTIRALFVTDGVRFSYSPPSTTGEEFTLHTLITALTSTPAATIQVDTAHRRTDPTATFQNFNFATTIPDLSVYDEIWMVGDEGINGGFLGSGADAPLADAENLALAKFMDGGGGVFAVGDHDGIGSMMCGALPRIRVMRKWFAAESPPPAGYPINHPSVGNDRADTLQAAPDHNWYFDLQSDAVPQTITHVGAEHPILQSPSGPIVKFPDHMHEGEAIAAWPSYDFTQPVTFGGQTFPEFPQLDATPVQPRVIAKGHVSSHVTGIESDYSPGVGADTHTSNTQDIGTLAVYDGFAAGVGRIVTGSTFHHYMDLNLLGDPIGSLESGADTQHGFTLGPPGVLDGIKTFYVNTALWLARPVRALTFAVDKSTFGADEVAAHASGTFPQALFVIVDGFKPSEFPSGGITTLAPTQAQLDAWAPHIPSPPGTNIAITPTAVSSDAPALPATFQRFTFTYQVRFPDASAFTYPSPPDAKVLTIQASLTGTPLTAFAQLELIKAADPFVSNLADGNQTSWLSADVRVFAVVEGDTIVPGRPALGGTPTAALAFINDVAAHITSAQFSALPHTEPGSALSLFERTLPSFPTLTTKAIYNFALARVRLNGTAAVAVNARVFFRLFQSQTAASLTYQVDGSGNPVTGFRQTSSPPDGQKIALLGISGDGSEIISVPCFAAGRTPNTTLANNMTHQLDGTNVKTITPVAGSEVDTFFGCWIDSNQSSAAATFLPPSPQANLDGPFTGPLEPIMSAVMRGVHQCIVAEVVYDEAPIIPGATPSTSDKLAQRNIAFTVIANPGAAGSRTATHTFEIRPTPAALAASGRHDELMIDWGKVPKGSVASIYLPAVTASEVLALADAEYATHDLSASDAHTIACPTGGITYVPVPAGTNANFAGLMSIDVPAGVKKGERYDVAVRQLTTDGTQLPRGTTAAGPPQTAAGRTTTHIAASKRSKATTSVEWRRVVGTFQIAIPVSVRAEMLVDEERTLSIMRWIGQRIATNNRWHPVFVRYLGILADRVNGLGGDATTIPATPTGTWPGLIKGLSTKTPTHGLSGGHGDDHGHGEHEHGDRDHDHDHDAYTFTGKVDGVLYDHFGDFSGFVLETRTGAHHRFESREANVHDLVHYAWAERITTSVTASRHDPERPLEIYLHGAPPRDAG